VAEKQNNTVAKSHEQSSDNEQLNEIGRQQSEILRNRLDRAEQEHTSRTSEVEALHEATKLAVESDKEKPLFSSPAERRRGAPSKKLREASLKSQLSHVQSEMNTSSRVISKIIHAKPVENASDVAAATIARPNALLSGSIAAFIGVTICYFVAKYYGYQLSGFETIAAFIVGWAVGILYDYFSIMIRGHRKDR
jgi:hypothetical protein